MKLTIAQKLIIFFIGFFASITIIISCRKIDRSFDLKEDVDFSSRFLTLPANAPSSLKRVADLIKKQNNETKFLNSFAKKFGFPAWSKSPVFNPKSNSTGRSSSVQDTLAFIPLVQDGIDQVYSFLACQISEDSVKIRLLRGDSYAAYGKNFKLDSLSAEFVAMHCIVLENKIFGHDVFRVNDLGLFRKSPAGTENESRFLYLKEVYDSSEKTRTVNNGRSTDSYIPFWTTYCVDWVVEGDQGQVVGIPPGGTPDYSYNGSNCFDVLTWFEIIENNPTTTVPIGGGGGGGGSGPWYQENPCRTPVPGPCGNSLLTGWVAVDDEITYNINWVDTIGISNSIQDSFPCLYAFLTDSLPNANYLAQLAGASVFSDSAYMHLTFDTSTLYTQQGQIAGVTIPGTVQIGSDGITHFHAKINFNGWYLRNGTKENMISTIVHETMHAIFALRWGQYLEWLQWGPPNDIDSFFIKQHFPIQWYHIQSQAVPLSQIQEHEIMATDYFQMYRNLLSQFWNPNASQSIKDSVLRALCYGGLAETTAWSLLPNQGIDTCKYKAIIISAESSNTGGYIPAGCGTYNYHYADSLQLRSNCN